MLGPIDDLPTRSRAALRGAVTAGGPALEELLRSAEGCAERPPTDPEKLRRTGLGPLPPELASLALLRVLPVALRQDLDRYAVRSQAYAIAQASRADEGAAITAVATALLALDLARFDLDEALMRVRQTLLEDAPAALLTRLRPLEEGQTAAWTEPVTALQLVITALARAQGVAEVLAAIPPPPLPDQVAPPVAVVAAPAVPDTPGEDGEADAEDEFADEGDEAENGGDDLDDVLAEDADLDETEDDELDVEVVADIAVTELEVAEGVAEQPPGSDHSALAAAVVPVLAAFMAGLRDADLGPDDIDPGASHRADRAAHNLIAAGAESGDAPVPA